MAAILCCQNFCFFFLKCLFLLLKSCLHSGAGSLDFSSTAPLSFSLDVGCPPHREGQQAAGVSECLIGLNPNFNTSDC